MSTAEALLRQDDSSEDDTSVAHFVSDEAAGLDHFVERGGVRCAGVHLIIDLLGAARLNDLDHIDAVLRQCVEACGATLLHLHLHHFTPNFGVSGVAVLAESHISIHTWPEHDYAALDVFMCGDTRPEKAIDILRNGFAADDVRVKELLRGEGV